MMDEESTSLTEAMKSLLEEMELYETDFYNQQYVAGARLAMRFMIVQLKLQMEGRVGVCR